MISKKMKCDCNCCNTDKEASHQKEDRSTVWPKAKGHLDTQLFPECSGTKYDRDVVKKTVNERKKKRKIKKAFSSGYEYKYTTEAKTPRRCNHCGKYLGDMSEIEWSKKGKNCKECILENDAPAPDSSDSSEIYNVSDSIELAAFSIVNLTKIANANKVRLIMDDIDKLMAKENEFKTHNIDFEQMDEATPEDLDEGYGRAMSSQEYLDSLETPEIAITYDNGTFRIIFHGNYEPSSVNAGRPRKIWLDELNLTDTMALIDLIRAKRYELHIAGDAEQYLKTGV